MIRIGVFLGPNKKLKKNLKRAQLPEYLASLQASSMSILIDGFS